MAGRLAPLRLEVFVPQLEQLGHRDVGRADVPAADHEFECASAVLAGGAIGAGHARCSSVDAPRPPATVRTHGDFRYSRQIRVDRV